MYTHKYNPLTHKYMLYIIINYEGDRSSYVDSHTIREFQYRSTFQHKTDFQEGAKMWLIVMN